MKDKAATLVFCVLGLYALFLLWSLLQERINTKPYGIENGHPVFFKAPLTVNAIQASFASLVGLVYLGVAHKQNPLNVFKDDSKFKNGKRILVSFLFIAVTSSVSSPLAYQSLRHVDYVAFLLAKSCKLLPVMFVHLLLYRTKFPPHKYLVATMVTGGVVLFTLGGQSLKKGKKSGSGSNSDGNVVLGMAQLLGSMLLDGFTNSTQDQMFRLRSKQKITGASLMCVLNALVLILTLLYCFFFNYDSEILYVHRFVTTYPKALTDILLFAAFGAAGQIFVFVILEKFDSLILVTATVTRKMISMILSVMLFGHKLSNVQWGGVAMVFGGIGYESYLKARTKKKND